MALAPTIASICTGLVDNIRSRPWIAVLFLAALTIAFANRTVRSIKRADTWASAPAYDRVNHWIKSSECTLKTGAILAICLPTGKIIGIEDVNFADDRGHTLIANAYALATGQAPDLKALTITNLVINAIAFYGMVCAFFVHGWKLSALLLLKFGAYMAVPGPMPGSDSIAAYVAAFFLAMIAAIWIAHVPLESRKRTTWGFIAGLVISALCLAWSTLLRQPYGLGGLLVVILILALRLLVRTPNPESHAAGTLIWRPAIAIAGLAIAVIYSTSFVIGFRDVVYKIARGEQILDHGISHNLYLGLGVENNPWGIKWEDAHGYQAANRMGDVRYGSDAHYDNLRRLYFDIVIREPITVLKIYAKKLVDGLLLTVDDDISGLVKQSLWIFFLFAILAALRRNLGGEEIIMVLGTWAAFGAVVMQGVLALPVFHFISPVRVAFLCGVLIMLETIGRGVVAGLKKQVNG